MWWGEILRGATTTGGPQYLRNRYYDAGTGRFTQQDPIGLAGGMNLYGFADGDPVNFSDPMGLCPEELGGDGKRKTLGDCPIGSKGATIFNRRAGGSVEIAPLSPLDAFGIGGLGLTARGLTRGVVSSVRSLTFGHGARHLIGTGLKTSEVERLIANEVGEVAGKASLTGSWWGRILADDVKIEYRAFTRKPGHFHVGTYYPLK